ncbi:MAG: prolyl-tRNA synthetase [Candidatus Methanoperedens nitroreducens]|uniref:Proline--tRNA ligase n=1 Tax=Candidatus Methanoperedens nitratireducens TaxID=1392998 RepID=A0A0P8A7P1_9EURY|nr:proline--tRNA ligase [Candidatus Methanoperedens sp. BLZ2]KAB2947354.1 MAG: proline--tRNA ligase [Candidatus Methanoperedens sp.]KPQ42644.1 MAG: prolyl-tRNA synthetase [Candidatus Methanoperedens sp. BLZ1]MBZ0175503.1 proline--tRNA ligase [Candidatus Methanoperedens nitroreducens]MCX9080235.1 proline--tRNA ligase [Candidatus Methanoperedens sp.]
MAETKDKALQDKKPVLPTKSNFSEWYNELLLMAEIMDVRYPVKGLYVWFPFGFDVRKRTYAIIRELLDKDHKEALFPLLIPENEFMKEAEHIKGFENEVYWVTHGGKNELDVKLALRPTSETAIYPMYKVWVRSHADLPIKIYQIVNTFRYETKHTRPLIRLREITSFKEAHTVHATWDEAAAQVKEATGIYQEFYRRLAIPTIVSKRPDWDKFPGADYTMAVDTLMPDNKTLQIGTAHHLGSNFAKTFDIKYEDINGEQVLAHQTCYGISERSIAALISLHGDDKGLVFPPEIAPIQVVIIPILFGKSDETLDACRDVAQRLKAKNIRVTLDETDERPGAKYYKWEMKGVPLRVEIGPRDLKNNAATVVRRDTGNKENVPLADIESEIEKRFVAIHESLFKKAQKSLEGRLIACTTIEEVKENISNGIVKIPWCGVRECGLAMEEAVGAGILGIPESELGKGTGICPVCKKETENIAIMAKTY